MPNRSTCRVGLIVLWMGCGSSASLAQPSPCDDANIDVMRDRSSIGASDQRRISDWVQAQIDGFSSWSDFRSCFQKQYGNADNSAEFKAQLAAQTASVAATQLGNAGAQAEVAHALARVLVDMNNPETFPGLIAGLGHADARTRYVCARGLYAQQSAVAGDQAKLNQLIGAVRAAGSGESSPAVLGRLYEILALPKQVGVVFDVFLALFDKRLEARREPGAEEDGAERYAFEFFRTESVLSALSAQQKTQLVSRVAVFLRFDAERYASAELTFDEIDLIERMLYGAEEILAAVAGSEPGGEVREALSAGGHGNRQAVLQEAYRWVGNPDSNTTGALNAAPWNVPVGAP